MPLQALRVWFCLVFYSLIAPVVARAYLVGPPVNLDKMEAEADLIFKGEALASVVVEDKAFEKHSGYAPHETRFKIISKIKGDPSAEVAFRHYDDQEEKEGLNVQMYTPQVYHFVAGQSYIVFAKKTDTGAQQVRMAHTGKMDLGVLQCRDQRPVTEKTLPAIYWAELTALRESPAPADVVYAIRQMDEMSEAADDHYSHTSDFSRIEVIAAIRPMITRPEPEIAQAAIRVIGSGSPYLRDERAPFWLGTVGVSNPGLSQMEKGMRNAGGALCWRDLAAVANSEAAPETRALAIRSLGLIKERELRDMIDKPWRKSPEPPIRAAAALLLTDFADDGQYIGQQFEPFVTDAAPEVRKCAAYAIGFAQNPRGAAMLASLLEDKDKDVRKAASQSLFSFKPEHPQVAAALKASLGIKEFQPLFLLALARGNPGAHLDALARVVEEKTTPENWEGGQIPAFTAWNMLFSYLRDRPVKELTNGKWDRYLNALEMVGQYSSSEPRDIYAFYLRSGLRDRAATYRAAVKKERSYDMDYYFNMVDKNPKGYMGN